MAISEKAASSKATDTVTVKKIVIEALLKGTGAHDNPAILAEIKALYDPDHSEATYPVTTLQSISEVLHKRLYPRMSKEEAYFEAGRKTFQGFYNKTVFGGIILAALKMMNPIRLMSVGGKIFADVGLGELKVEHVAPNKMRVSYRNFPTTLHAAAGIWTEAATSAGTLNPRYQIERVLPAQPLLQNFDLIYEWDQK